MKRSLIIGGSRFLGPKIIELLLSRGDQVTVFNRGNDYGQPTPAGVRVVRGDRTKADDLKLVLTEEFDYIYDMCCYDQEDAEKLLRFAAPGSHLVFLSTAAVYQKPTLYPLRENAELGSWNSFGSYGTDKAAAENQFIRFAKQHDTKITIFRPVYLLGENNYFDRENYFFSRIEHGAPVLVPGNGNALIQFAFLEETAQAFVKVPREQQEQVEILNIGGDDYISLNGIVRLCADIAGKPANIVNFDANVVGLEEEAFYDDIYPFPNLNFIVSNDRIKSLYGIEFMPLKRGLREIYSLGKDTWNTTKDIYPKEQEILIRVGSNT